MKINSINRNRMKNQILVVMASMSVVSVGCYSGGNNPGIEYAPNMYVSQAYEAYTQTEEMQYNPNGMTMRTPVPGTIAQGQLGYLTYPEGYEASAAWTNPLRATETNVAEGERLYNINCQHCHGKSGKNDGGVIKSGQYPPPPWSGYQDEYIKTLPDGKIFHTITYGKNNMGSHASVLTPDQRWQVMMYVRKLSLGDEFKYAEGGNETGSTTGSMSEEGTVSNDAISGPSYLTGVQFAAVDANTMKIVMESMQNVRFDNVRFKKMKDESKPYLDKVAQIMKANTSLKAMVVGHVSSDINADAALDKLSEIRANAVIDYLVEKGVPANRFTAKGMGANQPLVPNDSKENREKNRRVEIYFIK
ncbi:MAG: OmpA family protein [Bacteroidetes bacterium]|nr:OmpA family protein [Bacteroidota bacterium]